MMLLSLALQPGCARDIPVSPVHTAPSGASSSGEGPSGSSVPITAPASASSAVASGTPCGALGCTLYESPVLAFKAVFATGPRVLAVGEAHAPKGIEGVDSATHRFAFDLLPVLRGRATDVVVELWLGRSDCVKTQEKVVEKQKPVTAPQAEGNKNEFVELGTRAKNLGMMPHALRPTCKDFDEIAHAGDDAVSLMLDKIAQMTARDVEALLKQRERPEQMIVSYGGALHNDLYPRSGSESMSFGPELDRATGGKYVELDLFVPEYIKDTDVWRALDWYAVYDRTRFGDKTVLFQPKPKSYVLIFPRTASPTAPSAPAQSARPADSVRGG